MIFGSVPKKKEFSYTTSKSLKPDKGKDLRERMKFTAYTSQDGKPGRKKMVFFAVLLIIALLYMLRYGFRDRLYEDNIKIQENELEKVNGQ